MYIPQTRTVVLLAGFSLLLGVSMRAMSQSAPATAPAAGGLPGPTGGAKKDVVSQVIDVSKLAQRSSGVGTRRDLFDGPTITLNNMEGHISTLNVGEVSHQPHQHVNEELAILMEGKLDVSINDKHTTAEPGAVIFFASNDWHNVKSIGTVPAKYYVFNWGSPPKAGAATAPAASPAVH